MSVFSRLAPRLQEAIVARLGWSSLRPVQEQAGEITAQHQIAATSQNESPLPAPTRICLHRRQHVRRRHPDIRRRPPWQGERVAGCKINVSLVHARHYRVGASRSIKRCGLPGSPTRIGRG